MLCPVVIGREEETRAVHCGLEAALEGAGRVVVLLGDAGVGKSRLARELVARARQNCTVLNGRAVPRQGSTGLRALVDALQPAFRTRRPPETDDIRPFVASLARLIPEWRSEAVASASDPVIMAEGLLRLLRMLAGPTASVLVLEDLHWADAETLQVLEYVADHIGTEPVLCAVTCRTDDRSAGTQAIQALIDRRAVEPIRLMPLSDLETLTMARACLGTPELPSGVSELMSMADGLPFLVEELLASAAAVGALVHQETGWRLDPATRRVLPRTFAESVRRRVDELGLHALRVLRAAAMFGRSFDPSLVGPTSNVCDETVGAVLRGAEACQLVTRDLTDASTFRFRHALTREAILGELLPNEEAALAARALQVVRASRPDLPGEWCATAIGLAEAASLDEPAAELLVEAASRAKAQGALGTAEAILHQARQRARLGSLRLRADVETALLEVLAEAGKADSIVPVAERLLSVLDELDANNERQAAVDLNVARAFAAASRWDDASSYLEKARSLLVSGTPHLLGSVEAVAAEVAIGQQHLTDARERAQAALDIAQASALPDVECHALEVLGRVARVHDLDSAERYFAQAVEIAEQHGLMVRHIRALHELGTIGMLRGHNLDYLERASQLALDAGALSTAAVVNLQLGAVYVYGLEHAAALICARRSEDIAAQLGLRLTQAAATAMQATAHALAGDKRAAEALSAEALALADGHPDIAIQIWGNARGLAALLQEQRLSALAALDQAVSFTRDTRCTVPGGIVGPTWALLRTLIDADGAVAREEIRASRAAAIPMGRALLGYADAIALGRTSGPGAAMDCFEQADGLLRSYRHVGVRPIGLRLVAEAALENAWGEPVPWLREALSFFDENGYRATAVACRRLLMRAGAPVPRRGRGDSTVPQALRPFGVTSREVDVLRLVTQGLSNRQISERLYLSPKTVETHLEHLMNKMRLGTRIEVAAAGRAVGLAHQEVGSER